MRILSQKGQVLIETLIALGVAVVVVAAITTIVISSLNNAVTARSQDLASGYAKQGIEVVRNMAKNSWNNFQSMDQINYCLDKDASVPTPKGVGSCGQNVDNFVREIEINHLSVSCEYDDPSNPVNTQVVVTVSWTDGKCTDRDNLFCHKAELESCFSNVNNLTQ
ncbi:hypothetical protein C4577_06700 [Candidatus Parcubacteria bacterium]|nr:MAG: hypothetical protein C4577_06700 [Candidatus Parcubacteria bacterium]